MADTVAQEVSRLRCELGGAINDLRSTVDDTRSDVLELRAEHADTSRHLAKLERLLLGNGTPERGFVVRVDRLEERARRHDQRSRSRFAIMLAVAAPAAAALIKAVDWVAAWLA